MLVSHRWNLAPTWLLVPALTIQNTPLSLPHTKIVQTYSCTAQGKLLEEAWNFLAPICRMWYVSVGLRWSMFSILNDVTRISNVVPSTCVSINSKHDHQTLHIYTTFSISINMLRKVLPKRNHVSINEANLCQARRFASRASTLSHQQQDIQAVNDPPSRAFMFYLSPEIQGVISLLTTT